MIAGGFATFAHAAASPWIGDAHAAARLVSASEATGSATQLLAGIEIRLAPGWHTYWRSSGEAGIAPRVDWRGSQNVARAALAWPAPRYFSAQGIDTIGYETDVVLPVTATPAHPGQPLLLHVAFDYAACAEICVPYHAELALALPAGPAQAGPQAPLIARFAARVPVSPHAAGIVLERAVLAGTRDHLDLHVRLATAGAPFVAPEIFVDGIKEASFGQPRVTIEAAGRTALFAIPVYGAQASALVGHTLLLTMVDGRRAAAIPAMLSAASPGSSG
ncbi:MAG: protein-disulfide reductase DsbD domain-containing protein [Stellaceae bacterium]